MRLNGLGYMLDFGGFDTLIGLQDQHAYVDVFNYAPGAMVHVALGTAAALMPSHWSVLAASLFTAFEAARFAGGKLKTEFAGSLVEFSIGVLLGILIGGARV